MLTLNGVTKKYSGRTIIEGCTHSFASGLTLIVGPSGAGKSTLLRLCATVERADEGTVLWRGVPLQKSRTTLRKTLGYAPQIVDLPEDLTGFEFLSHMAALKGLGRGAPAQAMDILGQLNLGDAAAQRIAAWSGGMRRRLILAQALLGAPSLLALDEPTAELDRETAEQVAGLIGEAAKTATVLLTTHLADQLIPLASVRLQVADGTVRQI